MNPIDMYEILVRENEPMLQAYILGIVKDPVLTEDICQDAFVKAYVKLDTLKSKETFGAWLRTIAKNIAFEELKRRKREVALEPEVLLGMEEVFRGIENRAEDNWAEKLNLVERCFQALPEKLHITCKMYYFENHRAVDISKHLDISLQSILKRLERVRSNMRKCVERKLNLGTL
ncbi:MAG: hypothetical protein COA79_05055 [Planctomycetota bacterium]|nr:MAG: hypothetical protein COA79_05055 [Planctomycetota bacterium]